ncbi:TPA: hypothetical protein ACH3X2_012561 [Trebouxia sp. C0005]
MLLILPTKLICKTKSSYTQGRQLVKVRIQQLVIIAGDMKQVWIECANVQVVLRCFAAFALFLTIKSMMCDTSAWNAKGHKPE